MERSEELWILRCSERQKKKKKKQKCDRFLYSTLRNTNRKAKEFCEGEITAKIESCDDQSTRFHDPTCDVV